MKKLLTALAVILAISVTAQTKHKKEEALKLEWPKSENWTIASNQGNEQMNLIELIHEDESLNNWTEYGYMMALYMTGISVEKMMNVTYEQSKKNAPEAKLTVLERDDKAEYPWIIFMIESPEFKDDKTPESQVWYVVQGKTALFTNFRAVKEAKISKELQTKWVAFFKTAKVVDKQ